MDFSVDSFDRRVIIHTPEHCDYKNLIAAGYGESSAGHSHASGCCRVRVPPAPPQEWARPAGQGGAIVNSTSGGLHFVLQRSMKEVC